MAAFGGFPYRSIALQQSMSSLGLGHCKISFAAENLGADT